MKKPVICPLASVFSAIGLNVNVVKMLGGGCEFANYHFYKKSIGSLLVKCLQCLSLLKHCCRLFQVATPKMQGVMKPYRRRMVSMVKSITHSRMTNSEPAGYLTELTRLRMQIFW